MELAVGGESVLLAIVSDGAGSATFSSVGSRLVVENFARSAVSQLRSAEPSQEITVEQVRRWIDDVRDRIFQAAETIGTTPRHMAATLVGAIIYPRRAIICHVGDGACVLRRKDTQLWEVPSWPSHGEYASSTYFVTDDPEPNLDFVSIEEEYSDLAIFSDGIERLALDFANTTASDRFFSPMLAPLANLAPGRNRPLSDALRKYLDSSRITERTDDDKSLILAHRVG